MRKSRDCNPESKRALATDSAQSAIGYGGSGILAVDAAPAYSGERAFIRSLRKRLRLAGASPSVHTDGAKSGHGRLIGVALGLATTVQSFSRRQVMISLSLQTFRSKRSIFAAIGTLQNPSGIAAWRVG